MFRISRRTLSVCASLGLAALALPHALAQQGPIKLAVGATPGGTTDLVARAIAQHMGKELNQVMVVENKPGAAGNIAAQYVARSAPDGKTMLVSFTSFSINASLYKKLPFDPLRDFTPISILATVPSVLAVRKDFPANNMAELIAMAKRQPDQLTAGLGGIGSSLHMATASLKLMAGVDIIEVPFQGSAPSMAALLGGQIHMMFDSAQNTAPHMKAGTIKILGVTSRQPIRSLPGVPPIADTIPGFESYSWYGLFGPAKMPESTVAAYNAAIRKVTALPEFKQIFEAGSGEALSSTPAEFDAFLRKDIQKYADVVKATGAQID